MHEISSWLISILLDSLNKLSPKTTHQSGNMTWQFVSAIFVFEE